MNSTRLSRLSLSCALFVVLAAGCFAQMINGDLVGTVADPTGAMLAGATVTATNDATGVKATTSTGSSGEYRFTNLAVGTYTLTASVSGF